MRSSKWITLICLAVLFFAACQEEEKVMITAPVTIDETPYVLEYGTFPPPNLPADNPLTVAGVQLGRMLFYEKELSKDGSQACADCHRQTDGFSDARQFSIGVEGLAGRRQAMPVFNLAWHSNEFFWDGRATRLRDQALKPIEDPLEMNETLPQVIAKLSQSKMYQDQFTRAFGEATIEASKIALALEQFMLSIVSYQSKFDQYRAGTVQLSASEARGLTLFTTEYNPFFPASSGADCAHCHGGINFENDQYMNNGLDSETTISDIGRAEVTGNAEDRAKFKVPTLRNVAITGPYMHDGRFETLAEVIDHYNEGIQSSATTDPTVLNTQATGLFLTEQDKVDLINFLKTLTDEQFLKEPAFASPF
ncbi:MAG: cytochrome-c peroxidase [Saprospiraceae bacterium]